MGMRRSFRPTNIITNGNFAKGTTGWAAFNGTISVANNMLTGTGNGGSATPDTTSDSAVDVVTNKKIFMSALLKVTNSDCTGLSTRMSGSTGGSSIPVGTVAIPAINQAYRVSGIATIDGAQTGKVRVILRHAYADAGTANGKVMIAREVMSIDISTLPAEIQAMSDANIKAFCDTIPWFDGTMSGGSMGGIGGLK